LQLLANARLFHALGCPVLFGHSRKRFLADVEAAAGALRVPTAEVCRSGAPRPPPAVEIGVSGTGAYGSSAEAVAASPPVEPRRVIPLFARDRTAGTIGVSLALARQGVQILRVHDVAAVRQALAFFRAAGGMD
jgi:dihydropteroate synthase